MKTNHILGQATNLHEDLQELPVGRIAKRLRPLWPAIESKLAEGASGAEVLTLLNQNGFDMNLSTFKTYLHRHRKQRREVPVAMPATMLAQAATLAPSSMTGVVAPASTPPISAVSVGPPRPPTFDYDPRGIPDLLK